MHWEWMLWQCFYPTVQQAVGIGLSIIGPCILLRFLVLYSGLTQNILNILATILGILVIWWYYYTSVVYFIVLCGVVYTLLSVVQQRRGAVVSFACVAFILSWYVCQLPAILCLHYFIYSELIVASKEEWHKVRGNSCQSLSYIFLHTS